MKRIIRLLAVIVGTLTIAGPVVYWQYLTTLKAEGIAHVIEVDDGPLKPPPPPEKPELAAWAKAHPREACLWGGVFDAYAEILMHNMEGMRYCTFADALKDIRTTARGLKLETPEPVESELQPLDSPHKIEIPDCVRLRDQFRGLKEICLRERGAR